LPVGAWAIHLDDRLLDALALKEVLLGQALHEAAGIGCGLLDVVEVVR
jgi:hypothetical protein